MHCELIPVDTWLIKKPTATPNKVPNIYRLIFFFVFFAFFITTPGLLTKSVFKMFQLNSIDPKHFNFNLIINAANYMFEQ